MRAPLHRRWHTGGAAFSPLTVNDFLERAVTDYPERIAVIDEPNQPAASWGEVTYAELGRHVRAQAASLDEMGVPVGGRVAIVSQNSARMLTSFFGVSGWGRVLMPKFKLRQPFWEGHDRQVH